MSDTTNATLHVRGIKADLMQRLRIECAISGQPQAVVVSAALDQYLRKHSGS
jgi:hypothetical protein